MEAMAKYRSASRGGMNILGDGTCMPHDGIQY